MKTRWGYLLLGMLLACGGPAAEKPAPTVAAAPPAAATAPAEKPAASPEVELERVETARLTATIAA